MSLNLDDYKNIIREKMGKKRASSLCSAGGASGNRTLGQMKAELFGIPVKIVKEHDTSALGACMVAELGRKRYPGVQEAMEACVAVEETLYPTGEYREILMQRFAIYKELYPALKENMKRLGGIRS